MAVYWGGWEGFLRQIMRHSNIKLLFVSSLLEMIKMIWWLTPISWAMSPDATCRSNLMYTIIWSIFVVTGLLPGGLSMVSFFPDLNRRNHSSVWPDTSSVAARRGPLPNYLYIKHLIIINLWWPWSWCSTPNQTNPMIRKNVLIAFMKYNAR